MRKNQDKARLLKIYLVAFYLFSNTVFAIYYLFPNIFVDDIKRSTPDLNLDVSFETIILALLIIFFSYIFIGFYCFNKIWNFCLKLVPKKTIKSGGFALFWFVFINQFFYFACYMITGYGRAGVYGDPGNVFIVYYFALFPSDYIFLVYYAMQKDSQPGSTINAILYAISSTLRGWMGGLFLILIFESLRLYRNNKLSIFKVSTVGFGIFALSPFLMNARLYFRSDIVSFSYESMLDQMTIIFNEKYQAFYDVIASIIYDVFHRFQQITTTMTLLENRNIIYSDFMQGEFRIFLTEGWGAILLKNLSVGELPPPLMKYITAYLAALSGYPIDITGRVSSTNPTIMGWIIFSDVYLIFTYIMYLSLLMFMSVYLMCYLSTRERAKDMLWLIWVLLLIAGWSGAIEVTIQAQIVLIIYAYLNKLVIFRR